MNKTLNKLITKIENSLDRSQELGSVRENKVVFQARIPRNDWKVYCHEIH